MLHRSFKPAKCKTALKLATSRIKLMKNKKENHLKQLKKELAQLLESGQDQTARIRVEHVVREEKIITAYDLINIYCELIVARLPIIESQKNCPIDLKEAVASVVFAASRCADIPELQDVHKHFIAKYGKEFVSAAVELRPECGVSRILVEKLSANALDGQTKLKTLTAIAEEHNIAWDPKTFGQKESKPYDDLLKGPNTFDTASKMHSEPPIVQAPPPSNVRPPQGRDQRHDVPVHYRQNLQSSSSQNFASLDISGGQSARTAAPHPPLRPSGTEYERTEIRHSRLRDENGFSLDQQNWNMEFTDATAAAQAAAESAERASMAARAAAELSSREKITRQHSNESHKSNAYGMRDDKPRKNNDSPSKKFVRVGNYNLPQERNPKPCMRTEDVDEYVDESRYDADEGSHKDDHSSAKRFDQSASSRSGTGSVSADIKRTVSNFDEVEGYSRKSSFEEKEVKPENSASLSGTRVNKQSSRKDRSNYSRSSSSSDGDNYVNSTSHQNFVFDDDENPFGHEFKQELPQQNLQSKRKQTKEKSSLRSRIEDYDLGTDDVGKELPKPKLANKQGRKEDYTKSKFSAPVGYFDPYDDDSDEDLPKRPSTINVCAESGHSQRPKANPNSEASFHPETKHGSPASVNSSSVSKNKPDISESRPKPRPQSEKLSTTRPAPEEKQKPPAMKQSSSPLKPVRSSGTETSRTSSGEAPSRESSLKKPSHVHPKLPDYDSVAAQFLSLRKNRS